MLRAERVLRRGHRISPRTAFLLRLFSAFLGVLLLVGMGLYWVQARDARQIVIDDAANRHAAQGQLIEEAYASASGDEQPWDEVREVLEQAEAATGAEKVLLIGSSGLVVAASDVREEGREHLGHLGRQVLETGETIFEEERYDGRETFEFLSPVHLGDQRYLYEVEFEPALLVQQLAALKRSALQALTLSLLVACPLLYLLGGRALAGRYGAAAEKATRDGLTGLHNHRSFQEALSQEVVRAQRYGSALSLALIDVDDFKLVNDAGGHRRGDEVLVALAAALDTARSTDLVFRIGGDEFALLLPHTDLDAAVGLLRRLRQVAARGMGDTTISIGVADLAGDCDVDVLRDRADAALYEAKRRGRDQITTFTEIVGTLPPVVSGTAVSGLRALLAGRRMDAAFQPIWDLPARRVLGYEGLARPAQEYGLSGPADAFAAAGRLGRIDYLDALCRATILAAAADLPDDVLLFLNIAPQVLDHGADVAHRLHQEVLLAGLQPTQIVLELTEHASERMDLVLEQVRSLRGLGFGLALDDVGAGDTGLGLLAKIQPDFIKIDRGVVVDAGQDGPGRAVLAAMLAYANVFGAKIIAEGIETQEMLELIQTAHLTSGAAPVTGGQGYLLGRPSPELRAPAVPGDCWPLPTPPKALAAAGTS